MKYRLNTFMDESKAIYYPHSITVRYCVGDELIIGETYSLNTPMLLIMENIRASRGLLDEGKGIVDAIIKVNH